LRALHLAHLERIPFENLSVALGEPIDLEPKALAGKILEGGRGGFCYELNGLFGWLLEQLGFPVTRVAARPLFDAGGMAPPYAHLALVVELGRRWLVDVGFGFPWALEPLDLDDRAEQLRDGRRYAVREDGDALVVVELGVPGRNGYQFTLDAVPAEAFAAQCREYATSPQSGFVREGPVIRADPDGWAKVTRSHVVVERGGRRVVDRDIRGQEDWRAQLAEHFGYVVRDGDVVTAALADRMPSE
jgi:N-hydroxyarylamine O-acetyltransferase